MNTMQPQSDSVEERGVETDSLKVECPDVEAVAGGASPMPSSALPELQELQALQELLDSSELPEAPEPLVPPEPLAAPPEPPAPGEVLRKAREARGESLDAVARTLKLSSQQLDALESGRFDVLPGPTFVRGFLRNYARYLDIDPEPLLAGVSVRTPTAADLASMIRLDGNVQPAASPRPQIGAFPAVVVVAVAIALGVAGLIGAAVYFNWFNLRLEPPAVAPVLSAPSAAPLSVEPMEPVGPVEPVDPGAPVEPVAPVEPMSLVEPEILAGLALATDSASASDSPVLLEPAASALGRAIQFRQESVRLEQPVPVSLSLETMNMPARVDGEMIVVPIDLVEPRRGQSGGSAAPEMATVRLLFNASTLAQVRDSSGKLIFTRTGTKGASNSVRGRPPLTIMVRQANHVKLEFNGQVVDLKAHTNKEGVARLTLK